MTRRNWLLAGGAATITAGLAAAAYRVSPMFWRQYFRDLGRPVLPPRRQPTVKSWPDHGLFAAWLGHSTVLVKIDGFTLLTDPVFSRRAGINLGPVTLGVKRLVDPALSITDLPPIDLLLLSHAHMDHFDIPSLRRLENRQTALVTAWETADLLRPDRYRSVAELRWGQAARVGPATITAVEVKHWGARWRSDTYRGYNGYVIETARRRVLFAGDTALTDALPRLKTRRGFDLAVMPIGAYNPWIRNHCDPEQAWHMASAAGAEFLLPVHHQTFALSREPVHEPIERLLACAGPRTERIGWRLVGEEFKL